MISQVRLAVNLFQVVKRERGYIVELAALFIPNPRLNWWQWVQSPSPRIPDTIDTETVAGAQLTPTNLRLENSYYPAFNCGSRLST